MSYVPQVGSVGITGTVTNVFSGANGFWGGQVVADQVHGQAGTEYSGPSNLADPLLFPFLN
jgi:hypothetical protein